MNIYDISNMTGVSIATVSRVPSSASLSGSREKVYQLQPYPVYSTTVQR